MEYSVDELNILGDACAAIFLLMANSDGRMSTAEREVFLRDHVRAILASQLISSPREQAVMEIVLGEYNSSENLRNMETPPPVESLRTLRRAASLISHKEDDRDLKKYRVAMLSLAKNIAHASSGFLGLGPSMSAKEEQMLAQIKAALSP